jgi:hypothetical protein
MRVEATAYVESLSLDANIAEYWRDGDLALEELINSLRRHYSPPQRSSDTASEHRYREIALTSYDIIDLAGLPEDQYTARHMSQLQLRRLYVPLRLTHEWSPNDVDDSIDARLITSRRNLDKDREDRGTSIGAHLQNSRRLVILGDPGSGKTTLLRWLASAYLMRSAGDQEWASIPDAAALPIEHWLPIILRCRDLEPSVIVRPIHDLITHALQKLELHADDVLRMAENFDARLSAGTVLLLIDGLDEIVNVDVRARFARQIEQVVVANPTIPVVVTARRVGYRELGLRIGRDFQHVAVSDLDEKDKDMFIDRWCDLVEPTQRRAIAADELKRAVHGADRIEKLTGNPLMLTTMALVKRRVGQLPRRRADLYAYAYDVLLNWRPETHLHLDSSEATPQLEYLAYTMCEIGVQQLREDEVIQTLQRTREEYPHVRAVYQHIPETFIKLLESQTAIFVQKGHVRHAGALTPVFEFPHLTFQEYLAARAIVAGHHPSRTRGQTVVATVAAILGRAASETKTIGGFHLSDSWHEVVRLCATMCDDDVVDSLLLAVLSKDTVNDIERRARALLAAKCLTDTPNVSESLARQVIAATASVWVPRNIDVAAVFVALAATPWWRMALLSTAELLENRPSHEWLDVVTLCDRVAFASVQAQSHISAGLSKSSPAARPEAEIVANAATAIASAIRSQSPPESDIFAHMESILLSYDTVWSCAVAWLFNRLAASALWSPEAKLRERFRDAIADEHFDRYAAQCLIEALSHNRDSQTVTFLIGRLQSAARDEVISILQHIGRIANKKQLLPITSFLKHDDDSVRYAAIGALRYGRVALAVPALVRVLEHDMPNRAASAFALADIGTPAAIAALRQRTQASDIKLRELVQTALKGATRRNRQGASRRARGE